MMLTNEQVLEAMPVLYALSNADLPPVSSVRLGYTTDNLGQRFDKLQEKIEDYRQQYAKQNDDGEILFRVDARKVESADDADLSAVPVEVTADHRFASDEMIIENVEQLDEELNSILDDEVDIEVYPFPENETEGVAQALNRLHAIQTVRRESEGDLTFDEAEKQVEGKSFPSTLKAGAIRPILFMFEEVL